MLLAAGDVQIPLDTAKVELLSQLIASRILWIDTGKLNVQELQIYQTNLDAKNGLHL
jgi:hypothetical protein